MGPIKMREEAIQKFELRSRQKLSEKSNWQNSEICFSASDSKSFGEGRFRESVARRTCSIEAQRLREFTEFGSNELQICDGPVRELDATAGVVQIVCRRWFKWCWLAFTTAYGIRWSVFMKNDDGTVRVARKKGKGFVRHCRLGKRWCVWIIIHNYVFQLA